jgi:hypothetical protein
MGTPRRKGRCRKCGIYGHFGKECKTKPKEEREEAADHANADVDPSLLVAQVCNVVRTSASGVQRVFLNQDRVFPAVYGEGAWVLDTSATNHMTGCREVYFIPSLKCNIVGLGQLEEGGCRVEIDKGILEVFE